MSILKTEQIRRSLTVQLCAFAAGIVMCLFLSAWAALILLISGIISLSEQVMLLSKRQGEISKLCDEVDRVLHGAEHVSFKMFCEGELSCLAAEIQKMTARLREQNSLLKEDKKFLKEALEDMSHQLRTPMTTMNLILGMMREPELDKRQRTEYALEMCEMLARMQWIVETMLSLSRLEAGAVTFRTQTIMAADLINTAIEPLSIAMELKDITLNVQIEGEPKLLGDKQYLCEAIVNLLKNCMEHTSSGGIITIESYENSIYTGITITDSGEGIEEKDLPHMFERFYRGSHFSKNGYGIGLAFAQKIVTSQNGSLQVKNAEPHGAQFDMRIYKNG